MLVRTALVLLLLVTPLHAEVVRVQVTSRGDVAGGQAFGKVGPYETIRGRLYFAVDPRNRVNQIITDIDLAPKNAAGKVEFSADFYLIKPKDPSRGNGTVLYEVSNRGGKSMVGFFNRGGGGPRSASRRRLR